MFKRICAFPNLLRRISSRTSQFIELLIIITIFLSIYMRYRYMKFTSLNHGLILICKVWLSQYLIPKWQPINYAFVCMFISPLSLIFTSKFFCFLYMMTRQRGLINMQTKESVIGRHFGIRSIDGNAWTRLETWPPRFQCTELSYQTNWALVILWLDDKPVDDGYIWCWHMKFMNLNSRLIWNFYVLLLK